MAFSCPLPLAVQGGMELVPLRLGNAPILQLGQPHVLRDEGHTSGAGQSSVGMVPCAGDVLPLLCQTCTS